MITSQVFKPYQKKFGYMKMEFQNWVPALQELSRFSNPTRGFFDGYRPNSGRKIDHQVVLDGHARRACRTLASGMVSGLTSPSRPWFGIALSDQALMENDEVRHWCDIVEGVLFDIFARSNVYGALYSMYEELGTFGTGAMMIVEDFKEVILARAFTAGEYYLACDPRGYVNNFAREYWMTTDQLVDEFGIDNVSETVKSNYQSGQSMNWFKVCKLIEPNKNRLQGFMDSAHMPFKCTYWQDGEQDKVLRVDGFEEFPVMAPRWSTTTTADVMGRGPGWDALGDTKMLQKEQKMKLEAIDKVGNPPIQQDASVEGMANTMPGGVTRYNGVFGPNAGVRAAYEVRPDINAMREDINEVKRAIDADFYADLFLMFQNQDLGKMTATEVAERQSEKLQILGPVLERLENELLRPLIERTFAIANRMGLIPPPPPIAQGHELKIRYISILAQAQKMVGATAMQQVVNFVGGLTVLDPEAADLVDVDEAGRIYADNLSTPAKLIRSREKVEQRRQARAEAAEQAAQAQQAMALAKAGRDVSGGVKDLAQAPMGDNNALDATLGALTGAQ